MRIEREEKRHLKKLFVGILVMALLVTMLPYDGAGRFVAKAEDTTLTSELQNLDEFKDATVVLIEAMDADTLLKTYPELATFYPKEDYPLGVTGDELFAYLITQVSEDNKMILKLTDDIDLSTIEAKYEEFSTSSIGIDMGEYNLVIPDFSMINNTVDCYYYGNGGAIFSYYDDMGNPGEMNCWLYPDNGGLYFMGDIDLSNVIFSVYQGASLVINDLDLSISESENITKRYYKEGSISYRNEVFYDASGEYEKITRYYEYLGEDNFYGVDSSGNITTEVYFDIDNYYDSSECEEIVFEEDVIPEDVPILYNDTLYAHSNAENELRGNHDYGVHHIVNGTELVIDIAESSDYVRCTEVSTEVDTGTGTETTTEMMGVVVIDAHFARYVEENDGYTKITYAEGSIPQSFVSYNDAKTYDVDLIQLNDEGEASISESGSPYNLEFNFEIESGRDLDIINKTTFAVTATNDVPVWVPWDGIMELGEEVPEGSNESKVIDSYEEGALRDEETDMSYIKAGSKITLEPVKQGDTETYIYNMSWGQYVLPNSKYFEYCTDGTVIVTVPSFGITGSLLVYVAPLPDIVSANDVDNQMIIIANEEVNHPLYEETEDVDGDGTTDTVIKWFGAPFEMQGAYVEVSAEDGTITEKNQLVVCEMEEVATNDDGWSSPTTLISDEGRVTKTFYVMDVSLVADKDNYDNDEDYTELIPSDNYGARGVVTYTYVLDTTSPIITGITAEDAKGNALKLNGGWVAAGEPEIEPQVVWTNQPSVTVTATADTGNKGLALSDTAYQFETDKWQKDASYTYSNEGVNYIDILVRDLFDETTGRGGAGKWKSSVGIDTTAPTLLFTDAKNPTQSALKSDSTYEGNLHVVGDDANGSGFASINLEKKDGENWVAANELLVKTETGYYIAPTTQNDVYRIVITDAVGNTATYENVTVAGYTQDVALAVGSMTATYGNELSIPVTITNTSENTLQISVLALREDATDRVFDKEIGTVKEIAAGESFTANVKIPKGVDAGNYDAMLDIQYTNAGGSLETNIAKVYSYQIQATIAKAKGIGSVNVEDFYYGETKNPVVESSTNGIENVTLSYKEVDKDDSLYVKIPPKAVGTYNVKAVFPATTNYEELVVQSTFTISRMKADANMYTIDTKADASGVYKEDVVVKGLNGNVLCTSEDGTFAEKLTISESVENYVFYVKTSTGAITEKVELGKIVIDKSVQEDTEQPEDTEEPDDSQEPEKNDPIDVTEGKVRLEKGKAYTFGKGSWSVKGDNTSYAGGITFYVPKSGNYEFSQE